MLITLIDNKLKNFGFSIKKIDTYKVKASQFDHFTETYVKKPLSKRFNKFEQGDIQRDMYSAFLIMNTKDNLKEIDKIKNLDKKQLSSIGL